MRDSSRIIYNFGLVLVLLVVAWITVYHLDRESLWYDEGFTAFVVYDDADAPEGVRATIGYVLDSIRNVFERGRDDVHPLLYYVLMDGWTLIMGEAVWVLRLPSVFFGLIALAGTYTLGRELFDRPTGLIAALLLGLAHFFIYYSREARMYTLLVAITVLLIVAMIRWLYQPTIRRGLIMGVMMGLLMHTHYLGILIIIGALVFQAYYYWREHQFMGFGRWLVPHMVGLMIVLPWLPFAVRQLTGHPDGPLGQAFSPTHWGTITWLWDIMTSSHGGLFFIGFAVGGGVLLLRQRRIQNHMILLVLWFLITPLGLLLINGSGRAVMVARYMLVCLPPLMLMSAFGLRHIATTPSVLGRFKLQPAGIIVTMFLLAWLLFTQLTSYPFYWKDKPRWEDALKQLEAVRQSDEPAIINLVPHNVATYYARQVNIKRGISLNIGWNDFVPEALVDFVERFDSADSIWAILPGDSAKTWTVISKLAEGRTVGYRDSVQNMILYRFDRVEEGITAALDLGFYADGMGKLLAYQSGIGHRYYAEVGSEFCFPIELEAMQPVSADWHLLVSLTQGFNTSRAGATFDLPVLTIGDSYNETICLDIPLDAPRGPYLLRVALQHESGFHQPVVESDENLLWGNFIGVAWVSVDEPSA